MAEKKIEEVRPKTFASLRAWGESPAPPTVLATLIAAQNLQPFRFLPMLFPPVLLGSTYMSLNNYTTEAAGTSAAWSALYFVLAGRRHQQLRQKWGLRGILRGGTMGLCVVQAAAGGLVYALGRNKREGTTAS